MPGGESILAWFDIGLFPAFGEACVSHAPKMICPMHSTVISAVSGVLGSLVGCSATVATMSVFNSAKIREYIFDSFPQRENAWL